MAATKVTGVPIRWWLIAPSLAIALFAVPLPPWNVHAVATKRELVVTIAPCPAGDKLPADDHMLPPANSQRVA